MPKGVKLASNGAADEMIYAREETVLQYKMPEPPPPIRTALPIVGGLVARNRALFLSPAQFCIDWNSSSSPIRDTRLIVRLPGSGKVKVDDWKWYAGLTIAVGILGGIWAVLILTVFK